MSAPVVLQPRLLQVRTQYSPNPDTGDHPENVLWFQSASSGTPTVANLTGMAAAFDPAWGTLCNSFLATGQSYLGSIWTDYSTAFGASYTSVGVFTPHAGADGESLPPNVAALISLHILERYRGGHARIYLPYCGVNMQSTTDPSMIKSANLTGLTTNFAAINVATTTSGVLGGQTQMVYRQKTIPASAHLMVINSFTAQPVFASQRRRLRKAPHH